MWSVARRPRWIAALVLALAIAAAFAALGQWQLERSIAAGAVVERTTESVLPLTEVAAPQAAVNEAQGGQLVESHGSFVPGDFLILENRLQDGEPGYWLVGHFVTDDAGLGVALGWSATEEPVRQALEAGEEQARQDADRQITISGRYLPSDPPQNTDFVNGKLQAMSLPTFINLWDTVDPQGVYGGYVIADDAPAGLEAIHSPPPDSGIQINWLNIFYAAEWAIFAGFAVFLWWRLVKDAWELEQARLENPHGETPVN